MVHDEVFALYTHEHTWTFMNEMSSALSGKMPSDSLIHINNQNLCDELMCISLQTREMSSTAIK